MNLDKINNSDDSSSSSSSKTALRDSLEGSAGWSATGLENRAGGVSCVAGGSIPLLSAIHTFRRAVLSLFAFLHPYRYYDWDSYERQHGQRKVAGYRFAGAAC